MQTKLFCGIEHYYTDELFLGDEERQTCPFVEFFTNGDPESMVFCFPACHIAGMIADNPATKCKGDPWKCPLLDGALIKRYKECEELLHQAVDGKRENWHDWMRDATKIIYPEPSTSDVSVTRDVLMDIKIEDDTCPECGGCGEVAGAYFSEDGITTCDRCKGKGTI